MPRPRRSQQSLVVLAAMAALAGCDRLLPKGPFILDCGGAMAPGATWHDSYTLDLGHSRYCDGDCFPIQSVKGSRLTIDPEGTGQHPTTIELWTGAITSWDHNSRRQPEWLQLHGRCRHVKKSQYVRYE